MNKKKCLEVLEDILISIRNHLRGTEKIIDTNISYKNKTSEIVDNPEYQLYKMREQALQFCIDLLNKVDEGKIADIIQLRYFKLLAPNITESNAKIVADSLAKSITHYLEGK